MPQASTTLILGGGFGGIRTATALRRLLPEPHRIVLIDRSANFCFGLTQTWLALGEIEVRDVVHPLDPLKKRGIELRRAEITAIDPKARTALTSVGEFAGDHLVIALGAQCDMDAIPGLAQAAQTFYTFDGAIELRRKLEAFRSGEIVLVIPKTPFKCPPAPYEGMFLIQDLLQRKNLVAECNLSVFTVEGAPMATGGPEIGRFILEGLSERAIAYHPFKKTASVDPDAKIVRFEDGSEAGYDMLLAVPPHVAPSVVKEAGLTDETGWVPVDPRSLRVKGFEGVFAIGDVASVPLPGRFKPDVPLFLPKAGVLADAQGQVVARHIAAELSGSPPGAEFDGKGFCFIETAHNRAAKGEGAFFDLPHPTMASRTPDLRQFHEKRAWVEGWLRENLS